MNLYFVENRITKEKGKVEANSAQEAREMLGWMIEYCYVRTEPLEQIRFKIVHKLGNSIYAIETGLCVSRNKLRSNLDEDSTELINEIMKSVEKAKAIIEEFKS